ncbi:MAG: adenosylcobinamide-GDP ribazoletransferase [Dehalococcoidales bacterium]|nr:adenosylcobinamide-GDP ribazoletransferase [Dehalococcoidales bacterium]
MSFLAAIQFLTSIPIPGKRELSPETLGRATAWFPVVGLIIGLVLAGLNWLLLLILPPALVNTLLIAALVILTGALHLDGLADTCDGIAGHKTVEERWKVMHDSRTGAFGVVGIVLILLVKYVTLNNIPPVFMTVVLILMPVVSRWAMVYAIYVYRYARPSGLGTAFKQATRWPQFVAATIITLAVSVALMPWFSMTGLLIIFSILIITTALAFYFRYKFAGLTGDTYGAINELAEMMILVLAIPIFNYVGPI